VELSVAAERPLLVIAPEIQGAALALLLTNRERKVLAVKAPRAIGQQPRAIEELALITGARAFSRARGDLLADVTTADLGAARQAWCVAGQAGLLGGRGSRAAVRARLAEVQGELARADSDDAREKIRDRIGRLAGVAAIVRVGGVTEGERKERKQRVENAIAAGRAGLRAGVVPGGGAALIAAASAIDAIDLTGEEAVGAGFLARALEEPLRTMAANAGFSSSAIVHAARRRAPAEAYDLLSQGWVDPWQAGLVDPLLVLTEALTRSVSLVGTAMMIEAMVRRAEPEMALTP
jgi:chaperonin GroEL